ncbi:hypothetical protein [Pseudomonas sp.]|uniref:hypothetical protein n=1 Tax=Pseudomonas sp. TaxID=306 RepID=UPI00405468CC
MSNLTALGLTFPMLEYGKNETPWDLAPLLYRGGAEAKVKTVRSEITSGAFGDPLLERSELVKGLHDCLIGDLGVLQGSCRVSRFFMQPFSVPVAPSRGSV